MSAPVTKKKTIMIEAIGGTLREVRDEDLWRTGGNGEVLMIHQWEVGITVRIGDKDDLAFVRPHNQPPETWKKWRLRDGARECKHMCMALLASGQSIYANIDGKTLPICAADFGLTFKVPKNVRMYGRKNPSRPSGRASYRSCLTK